MGNWRTVHITGRCDPADVPKLKAALDPGDDYRNMGPLSELDGLCGLRWSTAEIDAIGNLAERDYSVESVAEQLRTIVAEVPSLIVRIDCGDDWESKTVIATVLVGEDRTVAIVPPQAETIPEIPESQIRDRLADVLGGRTRW